MRRNVKGEDVAKELLPGESPALLKELHLLTREGNLNADSLRKLKQVNHLVRLLAPAVEDLLARFGDPVIVDCGAGKGYLGFILYELFLGPAGKGRLIAIESRPELARAARERAARLGYERITFIEGDIAAPGLQGVPERVHLVTALHACDTATDDALLLALAGNADHVAVVPCCQAEVARQLERAKDAAPAWGTLFEHAWHRREFGSHLTNVARALALEARGYKVTVTELAGWEHSLKNELILGKKIRARDVDAEVRLKELLAATGVKPKIARELGLTPGASAPQ